MSVFSTSADFFFSRTIRRLWVPYEGDRKAILAVYSPGSVARTQSTFFDRGSLGNPSGNATRSQTQIAVRNRIGRLTNQAPGLFARCLFAFPGPGNRSFSL